MAKMIYSCEVKITPLSCFQFELGVDSGTWTGHLATSIETTRKTRIQNPRKRSVRLLNPPNGRNPPANGSDSVSEAELASFPRFPCRLMVEIWNNISSTEGAPGKLPGGLDVAMPIEGFEQVIKVQWTGGRGPGPSHGTGAYQPQNIPVGSWSISARRRVMLREPGCGS